MQKCLVREKDRRKSPRQSVMRPRMTSSVSWKFTTLEYGIEMYIFKRENKGTDEVPDVGRSAAEVWSLIVAAMKTKQL